MAGESFSREQKEFLDTVHRFRRRINTADFLDKLVSAVLIGAGAGVLFQAAAFVLPFYYVNLYTVLAVLSAVPAALAAACLKRCSAGHAALVMDSFGFQERIVTAYEHLGEEGELIELQRRDAMRRLAAERPRIRIPLCPARKKLAGMAGVLLLLPVLALIPSAVKERAQELHLVEQQAKEKEEEIEEVLDGLEELAEQGLTEEQLMALQEMMESLQSSMAEYQQASSAEALAAAQKKLDFKYADMGNQLSQLAESLQGGAALSAAAQSAGEMAQMLQSMSGTPSQGNGQMAAGGGKDGQGDGSGGGQGDGSGDGQGDGSGDGSGGRQGDGSGDGQGDGSGDGQGDGNGAGSGDGQGSGSGNGSSGDGAGSGRGEGSSSAVHDYVSVPNAVADSGNLTGNAGNHDDSDYFRAQNGLSWEGQHVSHESVIGSYQEKAYEGIAAGRYPDGMENVIKDYFSSFN